MKSIHKCFIVFSFVLAFTPLQPALAVDPEPPPPISPTELVPLIITEALPDPVSPQLDSTDEFVELYNPNEEPMSLAGYKLKTGITFQNTVTLPDIEVVAGEYAVITSADTTLSLVNSGTAIQLVDAAGEVVDEMPTYGAAEPGQSWIRNDLNEWSWTTTPTPLADNIVTQPIPPTEEEPTEPPAEEPPTLEPNEEPGQGGDPIAYLQVIITELLPDPAAPGQDSTDEFIELFNPNAEPINLKGYKLQSGSEFRYSFTLPELVVGAGAYAVLLSEESNLTLSNTGTAVRILDPNGVVVDEVANYGKSTEGQSWSLLDGGSWQWSTTPTPGSMNQLTLPPPKATAASKTTTKKATTKKATTAKPKVASAAKNKTSESAEDSAPAEPDSPPPNYWLLAGVGSMAAGYGLYEYRQDIGRRLRSLWEKVRGKSGIE